MELLVPVAERKVALALKAVFCPTAAMAGGDTLATPPKVTVGVKRLVLLAVMSSIAPLANVVDPALPNCTASFTS